MYQQGRPERTEMDKKTAARRSADLWTEQNRIINQTYKRLGLIPSHVEIIYMLQSLEKPTQKMLCDRTLYPKQTVHNIIVEFIKRGWITLEENPDDLREKFIRVLPRGEKEMAEVVQPIWDMERKSWDEVGLDKLDEHFARQEEYLLHLRANFEELILSCDEIRKKNQDQRPK